MREESVLILEIHMMTDGFQIEVHPLVAADEGQFVRDRLAELLPELAKQLKNPSAPREIDVADGHARAILYEVTGNPDRKKAH
jgi:hypothetical protein